MTSFEAGFLTYLSECGLPEKQASYILRRALDHPSTQEFFKAAQELSDNSWEDLDIMSNAAQLHAYDAAMTAAFNQIHA